MSSVTSPRKLLLGSICAATIDDLASNIYSTGNPVFVVDAFFENRPDFLQRLSLPNSSVFFTRPGEPTTSSVDLLAQEIRRSVDNISVVFGVGGGVAMDSAKAVSVLLTNDKKSEELQGYNLVEKPALPKVAIPTVFGTGAESSRTAVITNSASGLKLGINSDESQFDAVLIDSSVQTSVPKEILVITATDAYFHSMEILSGRARNRVADDYAQRALALLGESLWSDNIYWEENLQNIAIASYFAGLALTGGTVGLVHPLSAAISEIWGVRHTEANLRAVLALEPFYPNESRAIESLLLMHGIVLSPLKKEDPSNILAPRLREILLRYPKPLENALGETYSELLDVARVEDLVRMI